MTRRAFAFCATAGAALAGGPPAAAAGASPFPPDEAVRALLAERTDGLRKSTGMVVGLISPHGRRVIAHGVFDPSDPRRVDGGTVFPVGSVTKLFTALLLADMVARGEAALDEPVAKLLPPQVKVPERNGHAITLADLATHTSGLPFWPPNLGAPPLAARANYTLERFYDFLAGARLASDPGSRWAYSNTGMALLGQALALRAGADYADLVRDRITRPLGMGSTSFDLSPAMRRRLSPGHDESLSPAPMLKPGVFAPSGGAVSTADDLLRFLAMTLDRRPSRLGTATELMLATRRPAPAFGHQALGWEVVEGKGDPFINKDGVDVGSTASVLCDRAAGTGVVVLSNAVVSASDIARHLLRPSLPLASMRRLVVLPPEALDRFLGAYQLRPGEVVKVMKLGPQLGVQLPGLPPVPLSPVSDTDFVFEQLGIEIAFQLDGHGAVSGLVRRAPGTAESVAARIP